MARRLTESQKLQLVEGFRSGKSVLILSNEFGCSPNTVSRVVKSLIANDEYLLLKKSRAKEIPAKEKINSEISAEVDKLKYKSQSREESIDSISQSKNEAEIKSLESIETACTPIESDNEFDLKAGFEEDLSIRNSNIFKEVVPLSADFGFENNIQKVALKNLDDKLLPETVYLLVNQKIEIEPTPLKEFPEWNFLPSEEKDRNSISLFDNQRSAKRSCSRGQKVIKIPDSKMLLRTIPFLISKGITRIIFDEQLIALDKS